MKGKVIIGIDVSKLSLDYVAVEPSITIPMLKKHHVLSIDNDVESIHTLLASYRVGEVFFVLEPTGTYSDKLQCLLIEYGHDFSLVNPRQSHYFCEFLGISTKHDAQAARTLAYMGATQNLAVFKAPSEQTKQRKTLLSALNGLLKTERATQNRVHALKQYKDPCMVSLSALSQVLQTVSNEIVNLETALRALNSTEDFVHAKTLAMSIKGIGPVTAEWIITTTEGLANFETPGQLVKFCGLAPKSHRSGTSVHTKGGTTKQACAKIRASLFMAAKSAIRWNYACKDLYTRLRAKGKPYYKAIVAVMAKLLKQIFGVVKSGKKFDNEYYLQFQKKKNFT